MGIGRRAVLAAAACGVLLAAGCGPVGDQAAWQELPGSPLSPREAALGLWTGSEALLIGGSDDPPCPPMADCPVDATPLADGAALDPATSRWRRIADSPVPLLGARGVVVGTTAYVLQAGLLAYEIDRDTWKRVKVPFDTRAPYGLVAAGDRLVAYLGTDESASGKDYVFDPATDAWTALPADPLGAGFEREMAWSGRDLVLFDHELTANPGAEKPTLTRVAALDLTTRSWRRLPDSPMLGVGPWVLAGDRLVNPTLGGADGGQIGNWGRTYPYGGSVAPATGEWSPLPDPPGGESAGAHTGTTAVYTAPAGALLDITAGSWQRVPTVPGGTPGGPTVVAAGARMLVFGGVRWDRSETKGTLLNNAWIWSPAR
jgi:hypothetical protein